MKSDTQMKMVAGVLIVLSAAGAIFALGMLIGLAQLAAEVI
jgi:hypothetical protein